METETIEIPPREQVALNGMGEKFSAALAASKPKLKEAAQVPVAQSKGRSASAAQSQRETGQKIDSSETTTTEPKPDAPSPAQPATNGTTDDEVPKSAKDWRKLKEARDKGFAERDTLKAERDALNKRLSELAALKGTQDDVAETKKQLAERDRILEQVALDKHPTFRKQMVERVEGSMREARAAVGPELAPKLEQVMALAPVERDAELEKLSAGLSEFNRVRLANSYAALQKTENDYLAAKENSSETMRQLQEAEQRKSLEQQEHIVRQKNLLVAHIETEIDADFAGAEPEIIQGVKDTVRKAVSGNIDTQSYVGLFKDAARGRRSATVEAALKEEISKLQTQVSELSSATPPVYGTGGSPPIKRQLGPPTNDDVGDKFRKALRKTPATNYA